MIIKLLELILAIFLIGCVSCSLFLYEIYQEIKRDKKLHDIRFR